MSDIPIPRFNHVAMSVPSELIAGTNAAELSDFYADVFGWTLMPTMGKDGEVMVLRVHANDQFVFLHASGGEPMRAGKGDHFGLSMPTPEALDDVVARAEKYAERDPRVTIRDRETQDFGAVTLHSVYIGYRLPLEIELQCFDWVEGAGPQSLPDA